ncbi:MAG: KH domain-containing protein, partial [Candidatus Hermodarchaeota archaeon]
MSNIRMNQEELRFISILEGLTGALAVDCIWDKSESRVIFVVRRHDTGKVIGRGGTTIRRLRDHFQKQIDIVVYSEQLEE